VRSRCHSPFRPSLWYLSELSPVILQTVEAPSILAHMSKPKAAIEPSHAERQAAINKAFMALRTAARTPESTHRRNVRGPVPKRAEVVHVWLPDDGTREATIAAALKAGVSLNQWIVAAVKAGLSSTNKLKLPASREVTRLARLHAAEQERRERQRLKETKRAKRIATIQRLRKKGLTDAAIATELGITHSTLCHLLRRVGMQRGRIK
jgi:lambda repressor-like predicted transcriptional regulator